MLTMALPTLVPVEPLAPGTFCCTASLVTWSQAVRLCLGLDGGFIHTRPAAPGTGVQHRSMALWTLGALALQARLPHCSMVSEWSC
jgi:hypothetical protein